MGVVAASVAFAGNRRFVGFVDFILDRQGVDVGAQRDHFTGMGALEIGNHAGIGDLFRRQAECCQFFDDASLGGELFAAYFRMLVKMASQCDHGFLVA